MQKIEQNRSVVTLLQCGIYIIPTGTHRCFFWAPLTWDVLLFNRWSKARSRQGGWNDRSPTERRLQFLGWSVPWRISQLVPQHVGIFEGFSRFICLLPWYLSPIQDFQDFQDLDRFTMVFQDFSSWISPCLSRLMAGRRQAELALAEVQWSSREEIGP